MAIRIGVLGNCDTGGVSYALRAMLSEHEVIAFTPPGKADERDAWYAELPTKSDVILVNNSVFKGTARPLLEPSLDKIQRYPMSQFAAFHPDCCYVGVKATKLLIFPAYNSAICVAGYVRGLTQAQVYDLFCADVFDKLGYFDGWDPSVAHMQAEFTECAMDFRPFYLKVKRLGAFMHSMNHPKAETLITLARFLALGFGASKEVLEMPVALSDGLAGLDWPLYPEIGEVYGLRGSYSWKMAGELVDLRSFIARSFERYAELGLTAEGVFFGHHDFHTRFGNLLNERGIGNG